MNKSQQYHGAPSPDLAHPSLPGETGISEWITSYLDGEASGVEAEIARKSIQGSPEIRREAQDIQRAWDLLDFLPITVSPDAKTLETLALILRDSSSQPIVLEDSETGGKTTNFSATPELSLGPIPANFRVRRKVVNPMWPLALISAAFGGCLGFLGVAGWRFFEIGQKEKMKQAFGVVENIQILKDASDIDFLKAIAVPELFGLPDSVVAP